MPFVRKARPLKDPNLRKPNAGLTKYEKEIYDIYSKAFDDVRNQLGDQKVLNDILEALRANSASKVPSALNWRAFIESLDKTAPTLSKQIAAMANLHSKNLPRKIRYDYNFESKDPRAIAWAQTQAGKRIQGITLETQQAISNLISDGLRTKLTREEIIAELRQTVGLDKRQSRALGTFYEKRLNKYLEDGMTYEEAAKKAEKEGNKYRVRLVKQRAIRIARTEISAATNAGRYLSWMEANERDLLPAGSTKRWITARDERTCPVCAPMNGFEIAWTIPFSTGDQMPPAHPNCRCTAVIVPAEAPVLKHLQGKHNQKTHGKSGNVAFSEVSSSTSNFLNMSDDKGNLLAYVSYVKSYQIEIDMIASYQENKGYATKVVDELYQRFPNKTIAWGKTIEPASTHLAQKFSDKYGRTSFIPWGNGVIEGYEWGQEYGDLTAKVVKHLQGRHNQKTHGGGMGPNWEKGQWHQMSDKEYVAFISESHRLATSNAERRPISKTEWNKNYAKTDEAYLEEKPTRVYKNGKIVVFSNQSASPHHNSVNEGSFMRDVDDLQEKYPVDQLVIRIGDDIENVSNESAFGATVRGGQGGSFMWIKGDALNPNQMRQGGHSMEAQYKTGVRTYVLSHEWGHAIDKPDVPLDFASKDTSIRRTLSKIYTYQGEEVLGKQIMSTYGNSDPSEAFAEAFVDYVVGQDRGKPSTNPLVVKMAETFGWDKPWKK